MSSSSATQSSLSRYRPVVLTIVAGALACSTYYLYTTFSAKPTRPLHRSNAIHRTNATHRRRRAPAPEHALQEPGPEVDANSLGIDGTVEQDPIERLGVAGESGSAEALDATAGDASVYIGDGAETVAGTEVAADYTEIPTNGTGHPIPKRNREGQHLKQLLYYIAEEQCRQDAYVHRGVSCNSCDMKPIRGIRYRCSNCADFDLCSECEFADRHPKTHIFYKVKVPAPFFGNPRQIQPVAYPGKPERIDRSIRSLSHELRKHFMSITTYEPHEIDALYDQFTCLADWDWEEDPSKIKMGISRRAFDKVFIPHTTLSPPKPNLLYDRMFSFYDTNNDGLIGFEEFLTGIACVHSKGQTDDKLRKVFDGYDIDGDGFVSRKDFLRMFRAYYAIQKEITHDLLAVQEEEYSVTNQMAVILSSQPLSAVFKEPISPPSPRGLPVSKHTDLFGERRSDLNTIQEDSVDTGDREEIIANAATYRNGFDSAWPDETPSDTFGNSDAVRERRRRRQFYTDEEEGLPMRDSDGGETADLEEVFGQSDERLPQTDTQSSSKPNHEESVLEDSSTTPTHGKSSLPIMDRYRGYEFPEAEKDIGSEILYQVTQQGLNELLDAIFKEKEDLAMEVAQTAEERKMWRKEIKAIEKNLKEDSKLSKTDVPTSDHSDEDSGSAESDGSSDHSHDHIGIAASSAIAEVEGHIQQQSLKRFTSANLVPPWLKAPQPSLLLIPPKNWNRHRAVA